MTARDKIEHELARAVRVLPDDGPDYHRNAPRPDPACLYGLVGDVARAGSEHTEANPFAIGLNFMAYLSAALGRGSYSFVGNTKHHPRLFTLHVGRSGRGRKGDAASLVHRINAAVRMLDEYTPPQVHTGGLSTREGLALMIHDGWNHGKTEVEPIHDKRLWVVESEFANVLHQGKRDGNTLSSALRDAFDGVDIKPATKGQPRVWASNPHVCVSAAVTPKELLDLLAAREMSNGFANRFLTIWAERSRILPFPLATPQAEVDELAARTMEVIRFAGGDRYAERDCMPVTMAAEAKDLFARIYMTELNDTSGGERLTSLLERRAAVLRRLAMIFALCDLTREVQAVHITAALAWVRYWAESVRFIFTDATEEVQAAEVTQAAQQIVEFLTAKGAATRSQLTIECFARHKSKDELDAALDELLTCSPPRIEVESVPRANQPGSPTKVYRLAAKSAKSAKHEPGQGTCAHSLPRELSEVCEPSPIAAVLTSLTSQASQ